MASDHASHQPADDLIETILEALRYTFASILLQTDDLLFALAGSAEHGEEVNIHLDTLRFLRTLRTPWPQEASTALRAIWDGERLQPHDGENDAIRYALDALSRHIEALHHPLVDSIERRLEAATPENRAFLATDAVRPSNMVQALGQSLLGYGTTAEINILVIRLLDQLLAPALGDFYAEVEQALAARGLTTERSHSLAIDHEASGIMDKAGLLEHLDRLQAHSAQDPGAEQELWVRGLPRLPDGATLPPALKRQMELIGLMVYDSLTEEGIPPSFKTSLTRLHIPLLKAGLIDETLITQPGHPARRLWQGLIELAHAEDAEQAPWREDIHGLVEHLVHHFGRDLSTFDHALAEFARVRQAVQEAPQATPPRQAVPQATFEEARVSALDSIRTALAGKKVPNALRAFLMQIWGPLLMQLLQNEGTSSESHGHACELMERLILQASTAHHAGQPVDTLNVMLDFMQARQVRPQVADCLIGQLREALLETSQKQAKPSPTEPPALQPAPTPSAPPATPAVTSTVTPVPLRAEPAPAAPASAPHPIPAQAIENYLRIAVMPGDWYLVHAGEGQTARRLKVFHVDTGSGLVVFADRLDTPVLDRPIPAFVEDILEKRSRPIFEEERHIHALKQLRQKLEQPPGDARQAKGVSP